MNRLAPRLAVFLLSALAAATAGAQSGNPAARRFTTVEALRQFSGFYHLQNVVLRGEIVENNRRLVLRADEQDIRVILEDGVNTATGLAEVRGQLLDIGRLEPGDGRIPREIAGPPDGSPDANRERWPRPGEELVLRLTRVTEAQPSGTVSVRSISLEPWRYAGQKVTVSGNFRGRNLFGDLADGPGKSRYDFVLRGAEGAVWVTGLRPRGRGFDLDVNRRADSGKWVQVTGTVAQESGLVIIEGTEIALAEAQEISEADEEPDPPPVPLQPAEVVFSSPVEGEAGVNPNAPIRIQFSRGLDEASIAGRIRISYLGAPPAGPIPDTAFELSYDAATRAIELRLPEPMQRFRTLRVEVLEGLKAFDGAAVTPWTLTFSVGG